MTMATVRTSIPTSGCTRRAHKTLAPQRHGPAPLAVPALVRAENRPVNLVPVGVEGAEASDTNGSRSPHARLPPHRARLRAPSGALGFCTRPSASSASFNASLKRIVHTPSSHLSLTTTSRTTLLTTVLSFAPPKATPSSPCAQSASRNVFAPLWGQRGPSSVADVDPGPDDGRACERLRRGRVQGGGAWAKTGRGRTGPAEAYGLGVYIHRATCTRVTRGFGWFAVDERCCGLFSQKEAPLLIVGRSVLRLAPAYSDGGELAALSTTEMVVKMVEPTLTLLLRPFKINPAAKRDVTSQITQVYF
ncbi:hypothetical protein B0H14DRAFT_2565478 [Mycena olivaceomarginata]|nr:hypothetical protein B0H14DRAFT_2565478 [Mycena olivaceomarginata]